MQVGRRTYERHELQLSPVAQALVDAFVRVHEENPSKALNGCGIVYYRCPDCDGLHVVGNIPDSYGKFAALNIPSGLWKPVGTGEKTKTRH